MSIKMEKASTLHKWKKQYSIYISSTLALLSENLKQENKMSISEDEKLSQMIKDYIEIGSTIQDSCFLSQSKPLHVDDSPIYFSLQEIMEETTDAETEIHEKILFYLKDMKSMEKLNNLRKWVVFSLEMDNYEAHLCKTSWSTPFGPPSVFQFKGEYEYVDVTMKGKNGCKEERLIVDLDFRTQFELARPTQDYQELTNAIPLIFVGTEEKMEKLISLICRAAKQSLRERRLHVPPWRKVGYMHSKWFSENCKRVKFSELNFSQFIPTNGNGNGCFQDFLQVVQQLCTFNC
ncbi:hypothetical protein PHJA_000163600 [Phtheirospermum japonicum]|uniref:Uncharacterized protein n=1 Tax=Phtheirospermum japonicum TaxID=374723 RepID=A0A830B3R2_9LAMI|nr:hypothetical protein PHJA_000163600 [Phtheirospermum japonicum]